MKTNQNKESKTQNKENTNSPDIGNDKRNHEGEEFIGEGHEHDYSLPVAGEDGGTEDQSATLSKKSNPKEGSEKNSTSKAKK
jgi:hypothetical protein